MLENILKLSGTKAIEKTTQKNIQGGMLQIGPSCYGGDAICCGTANWQCGTGSSAGGIHGGYFQGTPICNCF